MIDVPCNLLTSVRFLKKCIFAQGRLIDAEEYIDKFHSLYKQSPRLSYLNARLLDEQSAQQRSNALLEQAIKAYLEMFDLANVPDELMMKNGLLCAQRQSFRGKCNEIFFISIWLLKIKISLANP